MDFCCFHWSIQITASSEIVLTTKVKCLYNSLLGIWANAYELDPVGLNSDAKLLLSSRILCTIQVSVIVPYMRKRKGAATNCT